MQDFINLVAKLTIGIYRFSKEILSGAYGYRATFVARLVVVTLALRAAAHANGLVSGGLLFAALLIAASITAFTAFISIYDLEPAKFKNKTRVFYTMVYYGTLMGTTSTVVLGFLVMLVSSVKEPGDLFLYSLLHSAVYASLVYTQLMSLLKQRMPK